MLLSSAFRTCSPSRRTQTRRAKKFVAAQRNATTLSVFRMSALEGVQGGGKQQRPQTAARAHASTDLVLRDAGVTTAAALQSHYPSGRWLSIARVDVSGNPLCVLPPQFFDALPSLTDLSASSNELRGFPAFQRAKRLERLTLRNNLLDDVEAVSFGRSLGARFPSLTWLDLGCNRLSTVPIGIASLSTLVRLRLDGNELRTLGPCLTDDEQAPPPWALLESLDLCNNCLLSRLPTMLARMAALVEITLEGCTGLTFPPQHCVVGLTLPMLLAGLRHPPLFEGVEVRTPPAQKLDGATSVALDVASSRFPRGRRSADGEGSADSAGDSPRVSRVSVTPAAAMQAPPAAKEQQLVDSDVSAADVAASTPPRVPGSSAAHSRAAKPNLTQEPAVRGVATVCDERLDDDCLEANVVEESETPVDTPIVLLPPAAASCADSAIDGRSGAMAAFAAATTSIPSVSALGFPAPAPLLAAVTAPAVQGSSSPPPPCAALVGLQAADGPQTRWTSIDDSPAGDKVESRPSAEERRQRSLALPRRAPLACVPSLPEDADSMAAPPQRVPVRGNPRAQRRGCAYGMAATSASTGSSSASTKGSRKKGRLAQASAGMLGMAPAAAISTDPSCASGVSVADESVLEPRAGKLLGQPWGYTPGSQSQLLCASPTSPQPSPSVRRTLSQPLLLPPPAWVGEVRQASDTAATVNLGDGCLPTSWGQLTLPRPLEAGRGWTAPPTAHYQHQRPHAQSTRPASAAAFAWRAFERAKAAEEGGFLIRGTEARLAAAQRVAAGALATAMAVNSAAP